MIDLHLHSNFSDGEYSPSEVVKKARKKGISVVSLTDHDTFNGTSEAQFACKNSGIQFISGVELEAATDIINSKYIHILGYNITKPNLLNNYLFELKDERIKLINNYIEELNDLGIHSSFEEISSLSPGQHLTAYHIPKLLFKKGYYNSFENAKKDFIDPNGKYYIKRNSYNVKFIVDLILDSGGIPVLAHPCRLPQKGISLDKYIGLLSQNGLEGLETYYSQHSLEDIKFYETIAKKYNLIQTAGSDWHTDKEEPKYTMGINVSNEKKIIDDLSR